MAGRWPAGGRPLAGLWPAFGRPSAGLQPTSGHEAHYLLVSILSEAHYLSVPILSEAQYLLERVYGGDINLRGLGQPPYHPSRKGCGVANRSSRRAPDGIWGAFCEHKKHILLYRTVRFAPLRGALGLASRMRPVIGVCIF